MLQKRRLKFTSIRIDGSSNSLQMRLLVSSSARMRQIHEQVYEKSQWKVEHNRLWGFDQQQYSMHQAFLRRRTGKWFELRSKPVRSSYAKHTRTCWDSVKLDSLKEGERKPLRNYVGIRSWRRLSTLCPDHISRRVNTNQDRSNPNASDSRDEK